MAYISDFYDGLNALKEEYEKIEKKYNELKDSNGKILPLNSYPNMNNTWFSTYQKVAEKFKFVPEDKIDSTVKELEILLNEAVKQLDEIRASNIPIIENNKKVISQIKSYMTLIGIPEYYMEVNPKSRARWPKKEKVYAGYISDITKNIRVVDNYRSHYDYCQNGLNYVFKAAKERKDYLISIRQEKEKEEKEKKRNFLTTKLILKYNLPDTSSQADVFWYIVNKDKYLKLAHYLQLNRGDWSNGYDYAEMGINSFKIESDQDKEIYDEINSLIEDDGYCDGRVFRDCKWNYDVLFTLADKEIYDEYIEFYKVGMYT